MRIATEALPFTLPLAGLALALGITGSWPAGLVALLLSALLALFFRIPHRRDPSDPRCVVAPANGRVLLVDEVEDPDLGGTCRRIVTFLSVFDVHVQRAPVAGEVIHTAFRPGRKVAAFRPEAAEVNECRLVVLRTEAGGLVGVRQIAGLLARRTVGYRGVGERVARGDLLGLIKFGSRVDLLLPATYAISARRGQRLREGETVVARSALP
ncbi:MAG: phosphatidylserine decarboxylase [Thermoanaerobaculia bacterium]